MLAGYWLPTRSFALPALGKMKGPYERQKYDLRRVWECSACHHKERTDGRVTTRHCDCQVKAKKGPLVVMCLVEDGPRRVQ